MAWLTKRPEERIAVVAHGGLLAVLFDPAGHGGHTSDIVHDPANLLGPRFGNCEVRTVRVETRGSPPRYTITQAE